MREIKFRGRDECGCWHYGWFVNNLDGYYIYAPLYEEYRGECVKTDRFEVYKVLEKTIGQFTGLYDKYGEAIFEGDIIQGEYNHKHLIRYTEEDARFTATLVEFVGRKEEEEQHTCGVLQKWINVFGKVVIGNIHDNPELLRGV